MNDNSNIMLDEILNIDTVVIRQDRARIIRLYRLVHTSHVFYFLVFSCFMFCLLCYIIALCLYCAIKDIVNYVVWHVGCFVK